MKKLNPKTRNDVHWLIALGVLCLVVAFTWALFVQMNKALSGRSHIPVPLIPYNELSRYGLETRLEHCKTFFGLAVGSLVGLWGVLILRPQETRWMMGSTPQRILLLSAVELLVVSATVASFYQWMVSESLFYCAQLAPSKLMIMSVTTGPMVTIWVYAQFFFGFGVLAIGLFLACAHLLASDEPEVQSGPPAAVTAATANSQAVVSTPGQPRRPKKAK